MPLGEIDLLSHFFHGVAMAHVLDHADDGGPDFWLAGHERIHGKALSDRRLTGPRPRRQPIVDDHRQSRIVVIVFGETAALDQPDPHQLQRSWRERSVIRLGSGRRVGALLRKVRAAPIWHVVVRRVTERRGAHHPRKRRQLRLHLAAKRQATILGRPRRETERVDATGVKSRIDRLHVHECPHQQQRADHENHAHRNLRADEERPQTLTGATGSRGVDPDRVREAHPPHF